MKRLTGLVAAITILVNTGVWAHDNGTHSVVSKNDPAVTMDKLEKLVTEKGMIVFARINHTAGAAKVGMTLRSTELLIFGNPKGGTPLMLCDQQIGLDLPLKMLVWQDEKGVTTITYNEPEYFTHRFKTGDCGKEAVTKMTNFLELVSTVAAAKN